LSQNARIRTNSNQKNAALSALFFSIERIVPQEDFGLPEISLFLFPKRDLKAAKERILEEACQCRRSGVLACKKQM